MKQLKDFIHNHILKMEGYVPGFQPKQKLNVIKLNTNESPFPPTKKVVEAIINSLKENRLNLYPNPISKDLRVALAEKFSLTSDYAIIGNGSDELIALILSAVLDKDSFLVLPEPTYSLYPIISQINNSKTIIVDLKENWHVDFEKILEIVKANNQVKIVVVVNPNAPTSVAENKEELLKFIKNNPVLTLVDEAYMPFHGESITSYIKEEGFERLLVMSTFSKAYSLAGQRIGWCMARPELVYELDKIRDSYNVNYLGQVSGLAAILDNEVNEIQINEIKKNRNFLIQNLSNLGFEILPSSANFIFTKPPIKNTEAYVKFLEENLIYVRYWKNIERIKNYVRITIGKIADLEKLIEITKKFFK